MSKVVYFIEDEDALNSYVFDLRHSDVLGDCRILVADCVEGALKWLDGTTADVVFVLDSRMCMSDGLRNEVEKLLGQYGLQVESIVDLINAKDSRELETLTGMLSSLILKHRLPTCRIILLSAFVRTLDEVRQRSPKLDRLLAAAIDISLPKTDPQGVTKVIKELLATLDSAEGDNLQAEE